MPSVHVCAAILSDIFRIHRIKNKRIMTYSEAITICERHHDKWKAYKVTGRCKNRDNVFAELNQVHAFLFRVFQKLDCQSCLKDLLHNVYNWYTEELNKKEKINNMTYSELVAFARLQKKEVPHNVTKEKLIEIISQK
jgi:hypothetical protein